MTTTKVITIIAVIVPFGFALLAAYVLLRSMLKRSQSKSRQSQTAAAHPPAVAAATP